MALHNDNQSSVVIKTTIYRNENFTTNSARLENDLVINFNNEQQIAANRSLLVDRLPLLGSMHLHNFKESHSDKIDINYDIDVTSFQQLMDYLHTGVLEFSSRNVEDIARAANYFQLDDLMSFCCQVFKDNMTIGNIDYIHLFANENYLYEIGTAALEFKANHFESILQNHVFLHWKLEFVIELLSSDLIIVSEERKVLRFILEWLRFDLCKRGKSSIYLFRTLRFSYLTQENLNEESATEDKLVETLLQVASESSDMRPKPRVYHHGIYMLGIVTFSDSTFARYSPTDGEVTVLAKPRKVSHGYGKLVLHKGKIYLLRYSSLGIEEIYLDVYDPLTNIWTQKATFRLSFLLRLSQVSFCSYGEDIHVFLRYRDAIYERFTSRMVYRVATDRWRTTATGTQTDGQWRSSTTTCGDNIYISHDYSTLFRQYTPSTQQLTDIPFHPRLTSLEKLHFGQSVAYKRKLIFLARDPETQRIVVVTFNTATQEFQTYPLARSESTALMYNNTYALALFNETIYVVVDRRGNFDVEEGYKVMKLDLSFIEQGKKPTLVRLPDWEKAMYFVHSIINLQ